MKHPFNTTITNLQIDLARSLNGPDTLSTTYASNIISGSLQNIVNGSLTLSSSDTLNAQGTARNFDIIIDFSNNPYFYDPTTGNLLLDVRNFSGGSTTTFDAQNVLGDSVSRVFTNGDANATTGNLSTTGLVTRFTTTSAVSTPEPSTYAMMFVGLGMLVVAQRKKKKAAA